MNGEPGFGAIDSGRETMRQRPELRRMIEMDKMRHFMRGEIVQDKGRRENQTPREVQRTGS